MLCTRTRAQIHSIEFLLLAAVVNVLANTVCVSRCSNVCSASYHSLPEDRPTSLKKKEEKWVGSHG